MSDPSAFGFGKFVPGFDFLQNLAKSASTSGGTGTGLPGMSNWVAPTLSVEELDKRIQELKAVQFWLEQNSTALKATIQALEVQKMTLSTLQGMNVNMAELAKAFSAQMPSTAAATTATPAAASAPAAATQPAASASAASAAAATETAKPSKPARQRPAKAAASAGTGAGTSNTVDPMQWWGSLTQQFQNIASAAMQDVAAEALKAKSATAPAASKAAASAPRQSATRAKAGAKTSAKPSAKTKAKSARNARS